MKKIQWHITRTEEGFEVALMDDFGCPVYFTNVSDLHVGIQQMESDMHAADEEEHDFLCPMADMDVEIPEQHVVCECKLIAEVREDERVTAEWKATIGKRAKA